MTNTFGKVNKFNIEVNTGFGEAVKLVYAKESENSGKAGKVLAGVKSVPYATANYACHHPYKVAAVTIGVLSLVALTSAYFLSPAYAAFVGKTAASAIAVVSNGAKALYAFAVANPAFAVFLALAVVAAVVTIGVLAYMNNDKANKIDKVSKEKGVLQHACIVQKKQIDGVKQEIVNACEKDDDSKPKVEDGKLKFDNGKTTGALENICNVLQIIPVERKA